MYEVIAGTGLRRGEALGLRWADCDLDRARLRVRGRSCSWMEINHRAANVAKSIAVRFSPLQRRPAVRLA
jgi:integrase